LQAIKTYADKDKNTIMKSEHKKKLIRHVFFIYRMIGKTSLIYFILFKIFNTISDI